jgi:hypothetical protein
MCEGGVKGYGLKAFLHFNLLKPYSITIFGQNFRTQHTSQEKYFFSATKSSRLIVFVKRRCFL